tara:strand:+ start:63 stop:935 length:873 start_codon:yes stop_codon:yes gene_type:complete
MKSPYYINEPAAISFSGGRTSAYMLYKILEAHDGKLPDDVHVLFANTGKEMPETLDFVQACSDNWDVPIVWLELDGISRLKDGEDYQGSERADEVTPTYRIVNHETASRNGEPFDAYMDGVPFMPNAVARLCTVYLKKRSFYWYLKEVIGWTEWISCIGIRADEKRRAVKLHGRVERGEEAFLPMWVAGETVKDVYAFWKKQNFDLQLYNNNGVTDWGNCDLCFLKGKGKRLSLIQARPDLADWWIAAEKRKKQQFRPDEPSYEKMKIIGSDQGNLFGFDDETIPCFCGD